MELIVLPEYLKYAFLGEDDKNPVIISIALSRLGEEKLLRILREYKISLGWHISDLKRISPSF